MLSAAALITFLIFQKAAIITTLSPGETITVQLARDYKIEPYRSKVKIAGSQVGVVQSISDSPNGPVLITLKVNRGTRALLGTDPSATIRPTTLLGGDYSVLLTAGGEKGAFTADTIPMQRTELPVELDRLLSTIPPGAQRGTQGTTERLDASLKAGIGDNLKQVLADAPDTLRPAGTVFDALRGINKDTDLTRLVTALDATARVLSAKPGQLRSVVDSLADTSRVLAANAVPLDRTVTSLPDTLRSTRLGADDLAATLDKLTATAQDARPTARALDPLLADLDPALADLRPVLHELGPLMRDAKPLVHELVPTVDAATQVIDQVNGPVLDRVNGPILGALNSEWHGDAPKYPNGGDGNKFYQEIGYMFAHLDNSVRYQDATSHLLGFQAGFGSTSVYGTGASAQRLQTLLSQMYGPPHSDSTPLRLPPHPVEPAPPGAHTANPLLAPLMGSDGGSHR